MIRGSKIGLSRAEHTIQASIHNRFDIKIIDATTGETKQTANAYNTLTNNWWAYFLKNSDSEYPFRYIHYGSGDGVPSAEDTSLFTSLGAKSASFDAWGYNEATGVGWLRQKVVLSESELVGETLTEVGVAPSASSGVLCSHARLEDMNGNPISLIKGPTDIVNIYATVFVHMDVDALRGKGIYFNPTYYNILRLCGGAKFYTLMSWVTPREDSGVCSTNAKRTKYTAARISTDVAAKTITAQFTRLGASAGNLGGLASFTLGEYLNSGTSAFDTNCFLCVCSGESDLMPVHSVTGEALGAGDGSTMDYTTDFPLLQSCTVYVDGQPASDVTVELNKPALFHSDYGRQLNRLTPEGERIFGRGLAYETYSDTQWAPAGKYYFENPFYGSCGIKTLLRKIRSGYTAAEVIVCAGDDITQMEQITTLGSSTFTVPEDKRHKRFWSFKCSSDQWLLSIASDVSDTSNVHFASPPPDGAVLTVDYTTKVVPKDASHVFDFSVTIQLGEHVDQ